MSDQRMFNRWRLLLVVPALALAACSSGDRAGTLGDGSKGVTTVVLNFVPVSWEEESVDVDPPGPSVGDRLEFRVPFLLDGKPGAELTGVLTTTKLGKGTGASAVKEERSLAQTFRLNDSDSIKVEGVAKVKPGQEPDTGLPLARTVVGGTGAYLDAKGSLETVRNSDGSYTYTFNLRLP